MEDYNRIYETPRSVKSLRKLGYPNHEVSNKGEVLREGRPITIHENQYGTFYVSLWHDGKSRNIPVERLVAKIFVPKTDPEATSVIHKNGDRSDNNSENLAWRSRSYAQRYHQYLYNNPFGVSDRPVRSIASDGRVEAFSTVREAVHRYGIFDTEIINSANNGDWIPYLPKYKFEWGSYNYTKNTHS